jgi:hypothetical protein
VLLLLAPPFKAGGVVGVDPLVVKTGALSASSALFEDAFCGEPLTFNVGFVRFPATIGTIAKLDGVD